MVFERKQRKEEEREKRRNFVTYPPITGRALGINLAHIRIYPKIVS